MCVNHKISFGGAAGWFWMRLFHKMRFWGLGWCVRPDGSVGICDERVERQEKSSFLQICAQGLDEDWKRRG